MEKWNFHEQYLSNEAKRIIFNIVINDLDKSYNENLERIKNNTVKEVQNFRPENKVIKGFC